MKAKPLTPNSYILESSVHGRLGIARAKGSTYEIVTGEAAYDIDSLEEFAQAIDEELEIIEIKDDKQADIEGFPIKHTTFFNVEKTDKGVRTYVKTESSNTRMAAGYFAVKYDHGWAGCFCPKYQTLVDYPWEGPYKTHFEMKRVIEKLSKRAKNEHA